MKRRFLTVLLALALLLQALSMAALAVSETTVVFSERGITLSGATSGCKAEGTTLTVTGAGVYRVSGQCAEGSIVVAKDTADVTLILDNLTLSSSTTAPMVCKSGSQVTVQAVGESFLTDLEAIENEDTADFEGAVIKVKNGAKLHLTGSGTLNLDADACKNGVKGAAEAAVCVDSLTLNITAANNALACDGTLEVSGGTLRLTAGDDGIKADPDDDDTASAGTVTLTGGVFAIQSGDDGIHAAGALQVLGGQYTIAAGDDAIHSDGELTIGAPDADGPEITVTACAEGFEGTVVNVNSGSGSITSSDDGINAANSDLWNYEFVLNLCGGTWVIDAGGDGVDSNGSMNITGGTVEVYGAANSGDSALDYETTCAYTGGTLLAVGMSGMAEAPNSGVSVVFGAAGGGFGGMGGKQNGGMGGRMRDDWAQDATIGEDLPVQPTQELQPEQLPMQPDESMAAAQEPPEAMGGMGNGDFGVQMDGAESAFSIAAGDTLEIQSSDGAVLYTATARKQANHVIFAAEALTDGESYTLCVNGVAVATATAQEQAGGMNGMGGGRMDMFGGQTDAQQSTEAPSSETPQTQQPEEASHALLYVLLAVVAVLLAAVVILLVCLLRRRKSPPSPPQ